VSSKPLPPERPVGTLDLLETDPGATPRNAPRDPNWRADALGRSRHSRLASEVRAPLDDASPERAEAVCAQITRNALGELAPALLLLSRDRRRRVQALTAWAVALFDLAQRPGLAGLDGDRLAQINAWEFRTEEALDDSPATQPVFVALAREEAARPWPRAALDALVAIARRQPRAAGEVGTASSDWQTAVEIGRALLEAVLEPSGSVGSTGSQTSVGAKRLAGLVAVAIGLGMSDAGTRRESGAWSFPESWRQTLDDVDLGYAPAGWRRAARYARGALRIRLRRGPSAAPLGLPRRLWLLLASGFR